MVLGGFIDREVRAGAGVKKPVGREAWKRDGEPELESVVAIDSGALDRDFYQLGSTVSP